MYYWREKMKIGVFLNNNNNPFAGGGFTLRETIVDAIVNAKTEHEFYFFFYGSKVNTSAEINIVPVRFYFLNQIFKKLFQLTKNNYFLNLMPLNREIKKKNIDIVYFLEPNYQPISVPYIATVWDVAHLNYPFFPEISENHEWEKREYKYLNYLRKATKVIVGTKYMKNFLVKYYLVPEEKINVLYLPVADIFFEKVEAIKNFSDKFNLPKKYFIYPAQFWAHKNHKSILLALNLIKEKYGEKIHVVFVGHDAGNLVFIKKELKKLNLEDQVHIFGFVSVDELCLLYSKSVGLVFPTFFGPDNLPPIEAFTIGCPVITSNIGGAKEQLSNSAIFVDPKNELEIARAMYLIYKNKKARDKLIRKGFFLRSKFKKENYLKDIINIFDDFEKFSRCWK